MRHAQIWPCSSAPGIADHSDHAPIIPAGTTVEPARPSLPVRMTFSVGTGINIAAICAWVHQGVGYLRMLTDDHDQVYTAISPMVDKCEFGEVVYTKIPNKPGELDKLAAKLVRAGIRINLIYAAGGDESTATVVLDTDNNAKAMDELAS